MATAGTFSCDMQITDKVFGVIPEDNSIKAIEGIFDHIHYDGGVVSAVTVISNHEHIIGIDILEYLHQQYDEKVNWMVKVLVTEDHEDIEAVCDTAISYVKRVTGEAPVYHDGGFDKRKRKHHVYALVH